MAVLGGNERGRGSILKYIQHNIINTDSPYDVGTTAGQHRDNAEIRIEGDRDKSSQLEKEACEKGRFDRKAQKSMQ